MTLRAFRILALLCLSLGSLALAQAPPVAGTILYSRSGSTEGTIWMAAGDGSSDTQIAVGEWPALSPDKHWMAYHGAYASGSSAPHSSILVRQLPLGADLLVYSFISDFANYYSFTPDSSKLYYDAITDINAVSVAGTGTQTIVSNGDTGLDDVPIIRLSDGAFAFQDVNTGLGIANFDGSNKHFIANTQAGDAWPQWSPDEAWLSFTAFGGGNIFKIHPDGSGRTQLSFLTLPGDAFQYTAPWTPDGKFVVAAGTVNGVNGLYAVATDGSGGIVKIPTAPGAPIEFVGGVVPAAAAVADLAVTPSSSGGPAVPGTPVNYTFQVTNNGPATAPNVFLGIVMPAGMTLNSYTFAACTPSGQVIVCTLGSIAANASITVTITATTSVVGTAFVTGVVVYDGSDPDPIIILLNSTQSTVTTVGTFSAGEIVGLTVDGSVCVSFTDWCTFGDGSLQKPLVSTHGLDYNYVNPGQSGYPIVAGLGDGINHYWLGGANYDFNSGQFSVAGTASTDTTDPTTMRMGAVAGSFTASPARTDFFLIGKSTALQIGAAAPTLFAQVNVCAGCYPNDTGSYSLTARRDFLAADPDNTNNSAIASAQIVAATTVAVTISPTAVTILAGSTQRFTAAVSNASDTTVTWSVNGIVGGDATVGTIDASGLYSAPASSGIVNINATSVADPSKSASAAVFLIFASTPALVADYQFAGGYGSSVGEDPALVDIGSGTNAFATDSVRGISQTVLVFPTGNGLQLSPTTGLFANAVYTVAALVRLDTISGYRRILDFKNATSDSGLYNLNGTLVFYPVAGGSSGPIAAGAYAQVLLTRAADGTVTGYVNGVPQFSFVDASGLAVIDAANVLRFFRDDNAVANENSSGAVARIRIWDGALTAAQVAALESAPTADLSVSVVPGAGSAATVTITNLGPASASNVVLTDTLDRFGFVSATPSQGGPCTFAASVVTCPLGSLAAGASATVAMVVTAPSQGWAAQSLKAISDALDPNPTNNAARVGPSLSSFNTPAGANVVVTATDSSGDAATVSFASVTRVGSTTISASAATTAAPAGFRFGTPAVIYDISSDADFAAPIAVALRFNPASFHHPAKVRLFHLENGSWVDRTTGVNLAAATVSAVTSTLSPFIVVEPLNNPPVANAGAAQALAGLSATGAAVKLDATSSSDADGDALTYRWTGAFPEGNGVVTGATPTVTVPLGASTVNLIVNDGENDSAPAAVSVTVADFLVAANSAAVSVKRGQSTTLTVAISPKFAAYGDTVALSCPNLPAGVTCSFSPAAITPGANGASATLTITTTASVAQVSGPGSARRAPPLFAFWFATLAPFGLVWTAGLRRRRTAVTLALMLLLLIALVACGGGGITNNASSQPPTPSSTVTITITGTSSSLQHSTTVPLTLQ